MEQDFSSQPINEVQWRHVDELTANDYNPNWIPPPELKLLKTSLLEDGWTTPIVAREDNEIVDGYHRWNLTKSDKAIFKMTNGMVPVVTLRERDPAHQIMSTIRHNRARGAHAIRGMSKLMGRLVDDLKLTPEVLKKRLGMEDEEVDRLYDNSGMPVRGSRKDFGAGWIPEAEEKSQ